MYETRASEKKLFEVRIYLLKYLHGSGHTIITTEIITLKSVKQKMLCGSYFSCYLDYYKMTEFLTAWINLSNLLQIKRELPENPIKTVVKQKHKT